MKKETVELRESSGTYLNLYEQKFKEALNELYEDPNEYHSDKRLLEQPAIDYFYEKHKDGPEQGTKHLKMLAMIDELASKHGGRFPNFIEIVNLDPDFPLSIEYNACMCEACEHINLIEVEVVWKAGVVPTNSLE